jgi:hypothetical protein
MIVTLGTDVEDALARLASVRQSTHDSKDFTNAVGARALVDVSAAVPGVLFGLASRASSSEASSRRRLLYNTVVSNVPGPATPTYFCGARMTDIYGMGPIRDGQGLFHFISSYCGTFTISTLACAEMLPDPGFYGECLDVSFEELRTATSC